MVATGIVSTYQRSGLRANNRALASFHTSYLSISLSLNVLLTLMIAIRLIVHIRDVRKTIGDLDGSNRLYTAAATVVTMLIESSALYAVTLLLFVVPYTSNSWVSAIFLAAVGPMQVRAGLTLPRRTATLGRCCLIVIPHRSSPRI